MADLFGPHPAGELVDPTGATGGAERVRKGASFSSWARSARGAYRARAEADGHVNLGFRCVR